MRVAFHLVNVHSAPFLDFGEAQQGGTVSSGLFCAVRGTRQRKLWRDGGVLPPLGTGVPGVPKTGEQLLTQLSPDVAEVLLCLLVWVVLGIQVRGWGVLHIAK